MTQTEDFDDAALAGQEELKRAYMQVSFGQFDEAIESCERAARVLPDHYLAPTLKGSFELAAGRVREALATLRAVTRRYEEQPLPWVYFAEACFLGGRRRQGLRALAEAEKLEADQMPPTGEISELIERLRRTWQAVEPSEVPPPLVAQLGEEASGEV